MKYFLDIGSHYGEGLSEFHKKFDFSNGWTIHCFEPNPLTDTLSGIRKTISDWTSEVHVHKKAVWNSTGNVSFLCSKRDPGELEDHYTSHFPDCYIEISTRNNENFDGVSSHIEGVRQNTWGGEVYDIESISGVDILEMLSLKDGDEVFMKIDAEGAEKEIVENFLQSKYVSFIKELYCEVHQDISSSRISSSEISHMCASKGVAFGNWY